MHRSLWRLLFSLVAAAGVGDSATTTGTAVDFYLIGSTVAFANAVCAPTTTNVSGQFAIPRSDCGVITVKGGSDVGTGLPFKGVFTAPAGSTVVGPVTTLIQVLIDAGKLPAQAQTTVMTALGLRQDPTTTDPMKDADALAKALALVQIAQQTAEAFTQTSGVTSAKFEDIYAAVLKQVATLLPTSGSAALEAAFVTAAVQATAKEVSPGSELASDTASAVGPAIAEIAKAAADRISGIGASLASTKGNTAEALALVTSKSNIDHNIVALTQLATSVAAELAKHDLGAVNATDINVIAAQVASNINVAGAVAPVFVTR